MTLTDLADPAVLTDGSPDPRGGDPTPVIVEIGKRLDAGRFPPFQLGIQVRRY